jgi:hypothetical protein
MDKLATIIGFLILGLLIVAFFSLVMGLPTMLLWNWLMPQLFGLKAVTFWQAVGLNMLAGILFKSYSTSKSK